MSGRIQEARWLAEWRRSGKPEWRHKFVRAGGRSNKVACRVCGRTGYNNWYETTPTPWQVGCLIGHRSRCDTCGAPTNSLGAHLSCKLHHESCCDHQETQWRRLSRLLAEDKG